MIPFSKPYATRKEIEYLQQLLEQAPWAGDGVFTAKCNKWLEKNVACSKALLTHSCTAALEMSALLISAQAGDEIIMPSFTFVSTANAFVLRGATPVFVDIRPDTLNLDETKIEKAITTKTKAIIPVHYAGVSCEMDTILKIAQNYNLFVIEDAAQGIMSSYKDKALGGIGHLGTLSFHDTKNITCGEGGALLINDESLIERAEIIREKGTNRKKMLRGQVDKYTWVDVGSSYLPSEINAAFLLAQLENAQDITNRRLNIWQRYHETFKEFEEEGILRRPFIPNNCIHNAHIYYLLWKTPTMRDKFISLLKEKDILSVFHYIPLHNSPAGKKFGRAYDTLNITDDMSERIVRLPLWIGFEEKLDQVLNLIKNCIYKLKKYH